MQSITVLNDFTLLWRQLDKPMVQQALCREI
jgi:hypothetical protein